MVKRRLLVIVFGIGIPLSLLASNEHGDPYASQFLAIFFLLIGAIVGGYISRKLNQPPVLGELLIGIIVGSILYEAGDHVAISIRHHTEIDHLISNYFEPGIESHSLETELAHSDISSETKGILTKLFNDAKYEQVYLYTHFTLLFSTIGVLLLLFMVGLEIRIKEMLKLGKVSFSLAFLGVLFPFLLGYLISKLLMHASDNVAIFMGATLGATSIGITARVLKDANVLHIKESKLILGAAVVDDILGLVLLAVVSGLVTSGSIGFYEVAIILLKASAFLIFVYLLELKLLRKSINLFAKIAGNRTFLFFPFTLLMFLAWLADFIGLATIVGAFCAGLIIQEEYFNDIKMKHQSIEDLISPIQEIFAPVFFVMMGFQVDVMSFADLDVLLLGLAITLVAIIGKIAAGFFIEKGYNKLLVGVGLVPRGEVGLIFASIGKAIGVLDEKLFTVVIIVVLLTTVITPFFLTRILTKMGLQQA